MKHNTTTGAPDFYTFARGFLHTYMPTIRRLSPKTVEAYRISLECFLTFLTDHEHIDRARVSFDHFDRTHLKAWMIWLADDKQYSARTITLRISALKAFLAYAAAEDVSLMALSEAARTLKTPSAPKKPIEYLTEDQTRAFLSVFTGRTGKSRRNRMLLILLYDTAARVSEITALTLADLSLTKPGHLTLTGKRDKTRIVPLAGKTIEHLRVYLKEFHPNIAGQPATRPLFYSLRGGQPVGLSSDTVAAVVKQAAATARKTCPTMPARIHCHMLRKTKAMDLYRHGIPLPIIMRLLGHENVPTTAAFYAFSTIDMMRAAVDAATPTPGDPAEHPLAEDALQALYSLR
ncbi:tyrosine-type recombinase/integrase [Rhodococcus opacus]|uniref:Tyrosine-type recombinase/integrase n=1 Tax=Rhodococcus opacus TaxID=37919 RepID=A0AAX3YT90_RHOOP|nr:tyrosine-type recombinase/integrase [Rhodococcus opacus]MCZ4590194.1 tyrosine-type recombinase/integrase [Rhodococcus opacus]WLF52301.1 tyrosine-type recombinase/integrase [Rhodococcus opacus]